VIIHAKIVSFDAMMTPPSAKIIENFPPLVKKSRGISRHLKCFMQSSLQSSEQFPQTIRVIPFMMSIMHGFIMSLQRRLKSIARNDAEPRGEYDKTDVHIQIHADIKAQSNSSCSFTFLRLLRPLRRNESTQKVVS
jgi:hypothetical protein